MSNAKKPKKNRLDEWLMQSGFVSDAKAAFIVVTEGRVFVDGQKAVSPAQEFPETAKIEVRGRRKYVGRGAEKLAGAMEKFQAEADGKICADIGSATGGFTQVLLENGAKKVYAIDTAKGKLDLKLREDPRVEVMEGTDVRDIKKLQDTPKLVTIDVSLVSLRNILLAVMRLMPQGGEVVALFKPQYETRDPKMLKAGIVTDDIYREALFQDFIAWAREVGWKVMQTMVSPIRGGEGNVEYLIHLKRL
ncbi:MAG: TlyA family RNA methyltransferase [Candidatus Sungbacteria bacterium]|nr:TlyA family RNA methyltransferase [Candidatus Sungbacteria bacterium]